MILKFIPYLLLSMASLTGGFFAGSNRATKTAEAMIIPCPACQCPPAAQVDLGNLDFGKINNRKGQLELTIEQTFDHITVVVDSATYAKILSAAKAH